MICPSLQEFWFAIFSFFSRSPNKSANNPLLVIFFIFQVIFTGTDKQCYPAHIDTGSENTHMGNFFLIIIFCQCHLIVTDTDKRTERV